jgi:hypothetical protein
MKICTICKLAKDFKCFYKHKSTKDGYGSLCKVCINEKKQLQRRSNGILPKRIGLDKERSRSTKKKWRENRKLKNFENISSKTCTRCLFELPIENFTKDEKTKDGYRNYCRKCRSETAGQTSKSYRLKNWAKMLILNARRHSTQVEIDEKFILELFEKQNKKCYWFDVPLMPSEVEKYPFQPSLDRLNRKLGYTKENVVLTCYTANIGRNISSTELFQEFCDILLKRKQS